MTMTTSTTTKMTASEPTVVGKAVLSCCPACGQMTRLHVESVRRGTEILCSECSAILRVEAADPLTLCEVDEEDLL